MILEITYDFKEDKSSSPVRSWTYYTAATDDFAKAVKEASKHFKSWLTSNGWTRKVTLVSILQIRKHHETTSTSPVAAVPDGRKRQRSTRRGTRRQTKRTA